MSTPLKTEPSGGVDNPRKILRREVAHSLELDCYLERTTYSDGTFSVKVLTASAQVGKA
jgi:hypothetical protein